MKNFFLVKIKEVIDTKKEISIDKLIRDQLKEKTEVTTLCFQNDKLNLNDFVGLIEFLKKNLNINKVLFSEKQQLLFPEHVVCVKKLTVLNDVYYSFNNAIDNNSLSFKKIQCLSNVLYKNAILNYLHIADPQNLDLSNLGLDQDNIEEIQFLIKSRHFKTIKIDGNPKIGISGANKLATFFNNTVLTSINISGVNCQQAIRKIADALDGNDLYSLTDLETKKNNDDNKYSNCYIYNNTNATLSFNNQQIELNDTSSFDKVLKKVMGLDLSLKITGDVEEEFLLANKGLNPFNKKTLSELDISRNKIGRDDMKYFFDKMKREPIKKLNVGSNPCGDEAFLFLLQLMCEGFYSSLKELNICNCNVSITTLLEYALLLKDKPLNSLSLSVKNYDDLIDIRKSFFEKIALSVTVGEKTYFLGEDSEDFQENEKKEMKLLIEKIGGLAVTFRVPDTNVDIKLEKDIESKKITLENKIRELKFEVASIFENKKPLDISSDTTSKNNLILGVEEKRNMLQKRHSIISLFKQKNSINNVASTVTSNKNESNKVN